MKVWSRAVSLFQKFKQSSNDIYFVQMHFEWKTVGVVEAPQIYP